MPYVIRKECSWEQDYDGGIWDTKCGYRFEASTPDPPSQHHIKYCCFCGKPIWERPYEGEEETDGD